MFSEQYREAVSALAEMASLNLPNIFQLMYGHPPRFGRDKRLSLLEPPPPLHTWLRLALARPEMVEQKAALCEGLMLAMVEEKYQPSEIITTRLNQALGYLAHWCDACPSVTIDPMPFVTGDIKAALFVIRRIMVVAGHFRTREARTPQVLSGESEQRVYRLLSESTVRMTRREMFEHLQSEHGVFSMETLKSVLQRFSKFGWIDNDSKVDPRGYALTNKGRRI